MHIVPIHHFTRIHLIIVQVHKKTKKAFDVFLLISAAEEPS